MSYVFHSNANICIVLVLVLVLALVICFPLKCRSMLDCLSRCPHEIRKVIRLAVRQRCAAEVEVDKQPGVDQPGAEWVSELNHSVAGPEYRERHHLRESVSQTVSQSASQPVSQSASQ